MNHMCMSIKFLGVVGILLSGGVLCKYLGWQSIFYVPGGVTIVWIIVWSFLMFDSPEIHPRISDLEKEYILNSLGDQGRAKRKRNANVWKEAFENLKFPIIPVLLSPCVWALWIAHNCFDWGGYAFFTTIPSFMKQVLFFDIESNGFLSSIPYFILWIVTIGVGHIVDKFILGRKWISIKITRKICTAIGLIGPALVLLLLWFTDCRRAVLAVVIFSVGVALTGVNISGFMVNYIDVAKDYTSVLYAIGNTASSLTGYFAPTVFGVFTEKQTHTSWAWAFTLTAGIMAIGGVVFCIFSEGVEQKWAVSGRRKKEQEDATTEENPTALFRAEAPETNEEIELNFSDRIVKENA